MTLSCHAYSLACDDSTDRLIGHDQSAVTRAQERDLESLTLVVMNMIT